MAATLAVNREGCKHMFENALDFEQAFEDHDAMHRTHVRRRLVALAIVVGLGLIGTGQVASALGSHGGGGVQRVSTRTYVVRQGDTLWAIASRLAPARDPRPVIQAIQDANGVDAGSLVPGAVLRIPALS
jgi:nucleoid-associated protein YgaU